MPVRSTGWRSRIAELVGLVRDGQDGHNANRSRVRFAWAEATALSVPGDDAFRIYKVGPTTERSDAAESDAFEALVAGAWERVVGSGRGNRVSFPLEHFGSIRRGERLRPRRATARSALDELTPDRNTLDLRRRNANVRVGGTLSATGRCCYSARSGRCSSTSLTLRVIVDPDDALAARDESAPSSPKRSSEIDLRRLLAVKKSGR